MNILPQRAPFSRVLILYLGLLAWAAPLWAIALGDIIYTHPSSTDNLAPAYFPHWVHRIKYKCYACHDDLFPMHRGANPTMAVMAKGESCGACHNGKLAFGLDTCHRCHVHQ